MTKCESCGHENKNIFMIFYFLYMSGFSIFIFVCSGIIIATEQTNMTDVEKWGTIFVMWVGASIMLFMGLSMIHKDEGSQKLTGVVEN